MAINEILRNRRIELGLSMKELAEKVGVSEGTISRWESGKIEDMKRSRIKALSDALHISPAVIMEWEDEPQQPKKTDTQSDKIQWYQDPKTAEIAQRIYEDHNLRVLFDSAKDAKPEDIATVQAMLEALLRKEGHKD